jgi:predicted nucleotidyltransferase
VLYKEAPGFRSELSALIPAFFNPMGATHHYRSMATQALSSMTSDGQISIKKFLYATRALMACRWIARYRSQPPTEFMAMVNDLAGATERSQIGELLLQKSASAEKSEVAVDASRRAQIQSELDVFEQTQFAFEKPSRSIIEKLDAILRHWARIGLAK